MKKILAVLLAVMMLLSMTACGSSEKAAETTAAAAAETTAAAAAETEAAAAEVYNVGICQLVTHDALDAATQGFQDALVDAWAKTLWCSICRTLPATPTPALPSPTALWPRMLT